MVKITCVLVDDGEPNLERCINSLRNQKNVETEILLCGGAKTDYRLAKKLADRVFGPIHTIGRARVKGILEASSNYIVSCDSDSIYDSRYTEYALENLRQANAVKAGTILPLEWLDGLALVETMFSLLPPYEFAYSFRRSAFLAANLHKEDYDSPRSDIGWYLAWRLLPRLDPRMPAALAAFATVISTAAAPAANELSKLIK